MTLNGAFTWQLDDGGYVLDLRRPAERGQRAEGSPSAVTAEPAVLLVSRTADTELDVLARRLTAAGLPVARIDADTIAGEGFAIDLDRGAARVQDRWITPTVTWLRHFSPRSMPGHRQSRHQAFAADSWRAVAGQLPVISATTIAAAGPGLLAQLSLATSLGIAVPRTVVTTDLTVAQDLLTTPRVVVKALHEHFVEASPGLLSGVFAEITERAALLPGAVPPVVVQEFVAHDTELRAYVAADEVVATFSVRKQAPADPWRAPEQVTAALVDPPAEVVSAARALARAIPIEFGAFDFLLAGGTPVFLEVNLAGDWRWLETKVRSTPVTDAAARLVSPAAREGRAGAARPARQPGDVPGRRIDGGIDCGLDSGIDARLGRAHGR